MREYSFRFFVAAIMALCVSLLFLGAKHSHAQTIEVRNQVEDLIWPSDGIITDVFGTRNGQHKGVDIAADFKSPIYAVDKGVIAKSYYSDTYGHVVFIKHENGFETVYAHLNKRLVSEGDQVEQGNIIGEMGSTGDSSGVHLHFEIHEAEWTFDKENALDPLVVLGDAQIGESVSTRNEANEHTMETLAGMKNQNDDKSQSKSSQVVHVVKKGETIWSIAKKYNSDTSSISAQNKINGDLIIPGQKLIIK